MVHMTRKIALVAVLAALGAPSLAAQRTDLEGARLRVRLGDDRQVEGTVVRWGADALVLVGPDSTTMAVEWTEVSDLARYRTRRQWARGLGLGGVVGAAALGTAMAVSWEPCDFLCIGPNSRMGAVGLGGVLGFAFGGAVGALIGAGVQSESWEPVVVPTLQPGLGSSVGFGVRWTPSRS